MGSAESAAVIAAALMFGIDINHDVRLGLVLVVMFVYL